MKLLIENGADVNYENTLLAASNKGHGVVVKLLLENRADVNALQLALEEVVWPW